MRAEIFELRRITRKLGDGRVVVELQLAETNTCLTHLIQQLAELCIQRSCAFRVAQPIETSGYTVVPPHDERARRIAGAQRRKPARESKLMLFALQRADEHRSGERRTCALCSFEQLAVARRPDPLPNQRFSRL